MKVVNMNTLQVNSQLNLFWILKIYVHCDGSLPIFSDDHYESLSESPLDNMRIWPENSWFLTTFKA